MASEIRYTLSVVFHNYHIGRKVVPQRSLYINQVEWFYWELGILGLSADLLESRDTL